MKILALEFSSRQRSVAVTDDADVLSEITTDQLKTGPLILIEQALEQAQIDRGTGLATSPGHTALRGKQR